jgi:predicted porin
MKKLFVVLALAGMVGSVSAATVASVTDSSVVVFNKGDKKKDKKKKKGDCSADSKCSKDSGKSGCCKDKAKTEAQPAQ